MHEIQRSLAEMADRIANGQGPPADGVRELANGINQLIIQMRQEQEIVRQWADEQATQQADIAAALRDLARERARG
jgi:predicted trehalose synthase